MNIKDELINNIVHAGSEENARKAIDSYTKQVQEELIEKINQIDFFDWHEKTQKMIEEAVASTVHSILKENK